MFFFFSSRRRHTRWPRDWSSDVCSSDLRGRDARLGHPTRPAAAGESGVEGGTRLRDHRPLRDRCEPRGDGAHPRARAGHRRGRRPSAQRGECRDDHGRPVRRSLACTRGRGSRGCGRYPIAALLRPRDRSGHLRPRNHEERSFGMRYRFSALALVALGAALVAAFGVGGAGASHKAVSGKVEMVGIWTATEQQSIQAVIAGFSKKYPGVKVSYTSAGNDTPTVLKTRIAGGKPPDVAAIGQPALIREFAKSGKLKPITFAQGA